MKKLAVLAAASAAITSPAYAAPILGLYDTGTDAQGAKLGTDNQVDTHYLVNGLPTFTTNNGAYLQDPSAAFIASAPNGGGGNQTYTLTFGLNVNPATASLSGKVAYDNSVTVLLNGHQIYSDITGTPDHPMGTYDAFQNLHSFSAGANSGFFVAGANTLSFEVLDYGAPTGLLVTDLNGSAVPEPASWAMMLMGFGMIGFGLRYRRKQPVRATFA